MKKPLATLIIPTLLSFLFCCGLAVAEDKPQLLSIKHSVLSANTEQVTLQLNGSYQPKTFTLKDTSPRIIFDFAEMAPGKGVKNTYSANGPFVQRIRVGMHSGDTPKTRVVFDVSTLKGVNYTQHFDEQSSSLIVHLTGPERVALQPKQESRAEAAPKKPEKIEQKAEQSLPAEKSGAVSRQQDISPPVPEKEPAAATTTEDPAPASLPQQKDRPLSDLNAHPAPPQKAPDVNTPAETAIPPAKREEKVSVPPPAESAGKTVTKPEPRKSADGEAAPPAGTAEKSPPAPAEPADEKITQAAQKTTPSQTGKTAAEPAADKAGASTKQPVTTLKTVDNPELEYIKFDPSSPKGEMVLFKLNGFHPPAVHGVEEGIPRVICDFSKTKLVDGTKKLIKTDGKFVKAIRTTKTKKPDRIRVIVDLEPNHSYDLQQVFFKDDNLYALIVNTAKK